MNSVKQRRYAPRGTVSEVERIELRVPPALKAHLEDAALKHRVSLNTEIVNQLLRPPDETDDAAEYSHYRKWSHWQRRQLRALQPASDDSRSDAEITHAMDAITHPWDHSPDGSCYPHAIPEETLADVEIDWLPGSKGELWNSSQT